VATPPAAPPAVAEAPPAIPIHTATEAQILANRDGDLTVFRFAPNPHILVLDFASLTRQGLMLNRVAALIEKAGLPRDRVLTDAELDQAIRARGETPETFYYGHDYSAAELARFFRLAAEQQIRLNPEEEWLRTLLLQEGLLAPGAVGAVISIPHDGAAGLIDANARATILHHELSHGEYFTVPAYADYAHRFWQTAMNDQDRARFTKFLASQDYDASDQDLMINETQAYLMHTADTRFFNAQVLGMSQDALDHLRAAFLLGMPPGWLRDCTSVPPAPVALPVSPPGQRRAPRRRQRVVSTRSAWPATRTPRWRAASIAR
jgi:hypothetical protein